MVVGNKEQEEKISSTAVLATITRGYPVGKPLELTIAKVRRQICNEPSLTDMEIIDFLGFCHAEQLDPFRDEIYLIKIPGQKAYKSIAILTYLRIAESNEVYQGFEAGIITTVQGGPPVCREGEIIYSSEQLVGGWAKVYRSDRARPIFVSVNLKEYQKFTKDGRLNHQWSVNPAGMIYKVALAHALQKAFPNRYTSNTTIDGECQLVNDEEDEFILSEPFMKDNEIEWRKVYARLKEMGLNHDEACQLLNIKSIKDDWIDKGQSIGDFVETVAEALTKRGHQESAKQEVNKATGEITGKQPPDDIIFPEATAAAAKLEEKIEGPKLDLEWAYDRILELQKAKNPEVEPAKLKERFIKVYHLQEYVCKSVKSAMANLVDPYCGEFAEWLSKL